MFLNRKREGTTKFKSMRQEKSFAKDIGGKVTPASGALAIKGDITHDIFLVECKTTAKTTYGLKMETLETLTREAYTAQKIPMLQIDLDDEAKGSNRSWVVIPKQEFLELMEKLNEPIE